MGEKLGLTRESRIKQGRDFARARTQGKRIANGCLVANWLDLPTGATVACMFGLVLLLWSGALGARGLGQVAAAPFPSTPLSRP